MSESASELGQVVLVTGGAKRVGKTVSLNLAGRGYRVAIHANTSLDSAKELVEQIENNGGEAMAIGADLTDESAARKMIDDVAEHFGQLDVLVHCAAIWSPKPLEDAKAEDVRRNFDINSVASFICTQHAGLIMC
ncbi:MAG: SDR family NAD(P)-dependent oxidoreductase, partial [Planctomycetota bacterium]